MNHSTITNNTTLFSLPQQPQQIKRILEDEEVQFTTCKRANTTTTTPYLPSPTAEEDCQMTDDYVQHPIAHPIQQPQEEALFQVPPRPTTPPLSMSLSHYDASTGTYSSSQLNSQPEVKSQICTGMTPVYRAPFERWGSCLI